MMRLIASVLLKKHNIECYFENASTAMALGASRSDILEEFKKDISKTATDLFSSQPIINSIRNGKVIEYDSIHNSLEEVFSTCYNKENNTITLSGVSFAAGPGNDYTKAMITELILKNLFDIDKKALSATLKTLCEYEETTDDIKKAILYPSTILADEIIKKISDEDLKFETYHKKMSYEDEIEFNRTFKRTGVTGVIQNSTYINADGIKQLAPSHKQKDAVILEKLLTSGSLKYIEAVEIDGDGSIEKITNLAKQIEKLTLNTKVKFTLKARKLGNLKARGCFFKNQLIVSEDIRDTSAILHEIAHLIHLVNLEDNKFVNYMIDKLTPMVKLDEITEKKSAYYKKPTEVVARACEIASLFAKEEGRLIIDDNDFEVIKSRSFYTEHRGLYFNFDSFDDKTKEELLALYKLFYETSPENTVDSDYDNFIKIDTCYRKTQKELSFLEMLAKESKKAEKELYKLYSMVNFKNINIIFKNRKSASIKDLSRQILVNIKYCGNHKKRMTAPDWMTVLEDKAGVINFILDETKKHLLKKEWIMFLLDLQKHALPRFRKELFFDGFSGSFRLALRKEFASHNTPNHDMLVEFKSRVFDHNIGSLLDAELLSDVEFVKKLLSTDKTIIKHINADLIDMDTLADLNKFVIENAPQNFLAHYINPGLIDHLDFMEYVISRDRTLILRSKKFRNNRAKMLKFIVNNGNEYGLQCIGDEIKDDEKFAQPFIEEDIKYLKYFTQRVQNHPDITKLYDRDQKVIDSLYAASSFSRKKEATATTSSKVLDYLSKDEDIHVLVEVSKNENTSPDTLLFLAKSRNKWIKTALAGNKNTPKSILDKLCKSRMECVKKALAKNPSVNKKVQTEDVPQDFDSLIEQGEIVDFERTDKSGVIEKVLRIKTAIEDFKAFNQYMKSSKKGYYSRFAKGFILYKDYAKEFLDKYLSNSAKVASVAATLYTADLLQNFSNGTLF